MKITHYAFGEISIDGKSYKGDVIIASGRVFPEWWRKEGHNLAVEDLYTVLENIPDILIIGQGASGVMTVPEPTKDYINKKGIELHCLKTGDAVRLFNELEPSGKKIAAAFHLTC